MDEEHTAGFTEVCAQCSAVDWGISDEGRFYCRTCHNVIERTKEVVDSTFTPGSTRISTLSKGSRNKRPERGRQWMICEGFQFILLNQADALIALGVNPRFKDEVLCQLWRIYLQKSRQAFCHNPHQELQFKVRHPESDSESAPESSFVSASETDRETIASSAAMSNADSDTDWSVVSGSMDAISYLTPRQKRSRGLMSMKKTLALIHLALVWSYHGLTISDLLRLVNEGHVPYVNAYEDLPDEMKLHGKDALLFRVESLPSHRSLHHEAQNLLLFLQLPAIPPITRESLLHPALLSLRYLTDANLPDELHPVLCKLLARAGLADQALQTFDRLSHPVLPRYDLQSAAIVILTMKTVFGLDDHTEWDLSNEAGDRDTENQFNLRRWYRLLQAALIRGERKRDKDIARKQWKGKNPLYPQRKHKCVVMKRKRISDQLQICFEKLSGSACGVQRAAPSSFLFQWGGEEGADGPSMRHRTLGNDLTTQGSEYWHPALRTCKTSHCRSHYSEVEPTLPRSFAWLLRLFCFLLDVKPPELYQEVLRVERLVIGSKRQTRK